MTMSGPEHFGGSSRADARRAERERRDREDRREKEAGDEERRREMREMGWEYVMKRSTQSSDHAFESASARYRERGENDVTILQPPSGGPEELWVRPRKQ